MDSAGACSAFEMATNVACELVGAYAASPALWAVTLQLPAAVVTSWKDGAVPTTWQPVPAALSVTV
jgi:hypothetical protein